VRDPTAEPAPDLVNRHFTVDQPDRLWIIDITEHPTEEGKIYCAAVMDAYSRLIIRLVHRQPRNATATRTGRIYTQPPRPGANRPNASPAARKHHQSTSNASTPTTVKHR
jgi:transposase InsO family protein